MILLALILLLAPATQPNFDDSRADGLIAHGQFLAARSDHAGAIARDEQALRLEPSATPAHAWKAASLISLGQLERAEVEIGAALKNEMKDFTYLMIAGRLAVARGEYDKAGELYGRAAEMSVKNAGIIYADLASALSSRKEAALDGKIEAALKSAAAADPPHLDSLFNLAQSYANANRQEARATLRRYIELAGKQPESERNARQYQLARQLLRAMEIVNSR